MARKVQPVLEKLMRRVVDEQPFDVEGHFIQQLTAIVGGADMGMPMSSSRPGTAQSERPNTAATTASAGRELSRGACDALFRMVDEESTVSPTRIS